MKQRFMNQKLGKRMSRKTELRKAKLFVTARERPLRQGFPERNAPAGKLR